VCLRPCVLLRSPSNIFSTFVKKVCNCKCTDDSSKSYRNVCKMSFVSLSLAVLFIIRLFMKKRMQALMVSPVPSFFTRHNTGMTQEDVPHSPTSDCDQIDFDTIPSNSDMLVVYSTQEGNVSWLRLFSATPWLFFMPTVTTWGASGANLFAQLGLCVTGFCFACCFFLLM